MGKEDNAGAEIRAADVSEQDTYAIGREAYWYTYPLVLMDLTRQQMTNIEAGKMPGRGPMMVFTHRHAFPGANDREVVRPNFDTLYSLAWLDLTKEPAIISVPDVEEGRFYMLPMLDMWTDVFAIVGTRATGTKGGHYAIARPDWKGELPAGVTRIDAPTPYVWIIGRTQTNGPRDYSAVHKIQDAYGLTSLSQRGKTPQPIKVEIDPGIDMKTPPLEQINNMAAKAYFEYAAELMKKHPPHITDQVVIARMKRIGLEAGKSLNFDKLDPKIKQALKQACTDGLKAMQARYQKMGREANGWRITTGTGVYGDNYLDRAVIDMVGLGANPPEEAIYPVNFADSEGNPVDGKNNYVLHFEKDQLPPVDAFWSVTMYDEAGFQAANRLNRFALGDRDDLVFNPDGSLDIYIQHESPGKAKEPNWLPAPKGPLGITLRLYLPGMEALDGTWTPPPIRKVD